MKFFLLATFILIFTANVSPFAPGEKETVNRDPSTITIASYNTWGLPLWMPGHDQGNRYKELPKALASSEVDILCLQETFSKRLRQPLVDSLSRHFFSYSDYSCNKRILGPWVRDCYGGLMTWSRYPIIEETFIQYSRVSGMNLEEKIGSKGFLISTLLIDDILLYVVNTHLYAGMDKNAERIRYHQIMELEAELSQEKYNDFPILLAGDFNITHPQVASMYNDLNPSQVYDCVINDLDFQDSCPSLNNESYTIDPRKNIFQQSAKHLQRLDYIFYKNGKRRPEICVNQQELFMKDSPLSDHLGWKVQLSLSSQNNIQSFTSH
jgi:endonuclease/exonuclease/phosphatase family metal-dependent hydrolase